MIEGKLFINGEFVDSAGETTLESINPANSEVIAKVAEAREADIDKAVQAARRAFEEGSWPKMSATDRGRLLRRIADLIQEGRGELARLETMDVGKPIRDSSRVDLPLVVDCFEYFAGMADKVMGETIPVPGKFLNFTLREPVGVVGQIIPWNYPLLMAAWKMAPALAAGCTVVLKPAEQTPVTALELAKICQEAEVPPGVVNICPGFGEPAGAALASHPDVDKVAFTGSTAVGKLIMEMGAKNVKRVSLELGGKSPNIVLDDADLEEAVPGALFAIFLNSGQVCAAGSRLFVHEKIYDTFMERFLEGAKNIKLGDPLDKETQLGPLVSAEQLEKVETYVQIGQEEGAKLVLGGKRPDNPALAKGFYFEPTVFVDVDYRMRIAQEEIFGPVVVVIRFSDDRELIKMANSTIYGLAAGIWTTNVKRAVNLAKAIKAGNIWVNTYNMIPNQAPFGGFKQSGVGREMSRHVMDLYTEVKNVMVYLGKGGVRWFG